MAGLIPDGFIDDLLSRTDLVELVRSRVTIKKSGKNYVGCCPFHQEKTPSFSVAPHKQFYYCFGCGAQGDALRFLMEFDHLSFPQAVEQLATVAGMDVPRQQETQQQRHERSRNQLLYELLERASHYFKNQLRQPSSQAAHRYMETRGLDDAICQEYGIGYAPPGFDNLGSGLALDHAGRDLALTGGLLAESDNSDRRYDKFRDRLMFPIRDGRGRTVGFGGRLLGDGKPKYLNSPETPVFHKGQELYGLWEWRQTRQSDNALLVVEGYMDVISLAQFGIHNCVATLGTATSEIHVNKLFRDVDEIIFCFDGDKAGRRAAWRALESTLSELSDGKNVRFLFLPDGEDPDTLVRKEGPEALRAACNKALSLDEFLFQQLATDLDLAQISGRAKLAKLALPYISQLKGDIYRSLLKQSLAKRTGLAERELEQLTAPTPNTPPTATPKTKNTNSQPRKRPARRRRDQQQPLSLIERLLVILLQYPTLARSHPCELPLHEMDVPYLGMLQKVLTALTKDDSINNAPRALGVLMALDEHNQLEHLFQTRPVAASKTLAAREWQGGLLQLEIMQLDRQLQAERTATPVNTSKLMALFKHRQQLQTQRQALDHHEE